MIPELASEYKTRAPAETLKNWTSSQNGNRCSSSLFPKKKDLCFPYNPTITKLFHIEAILSARNHPCKLKLCKRNMKQPHLPEEEEEDEERKESQSSCGFYCGFLLSLGFLIWMMVPHPYNPMGNKAAPIPYIVLRTQDGKTNEALYACECDRTASENHIECIESKKTKSRYLGDSICIYTWSDDELVEDDILELRFIMHKLTWIYKKGNSYSPIANGVADQSTELVSFQNNSVVMTVSLNQTWFPNEFYIGKIVLTTRGNAESGSRLLRGNSTTQTDDS